MPFVRKRLHKHQKKQYLTVRNSDLTRRLTGKQNTEGIKILFDRHHITAYDEKACLLYRKR